jgi:hypothetical protein
MLTVLTQLGPSPMGATCQLQPKSPPPWNCGCVHSTRKRFHPLFLEDTENWVCPGVIEVALCLSAKW